MFKHAENRQILTVKYQASPTRQEQYSWTDEHKEKKSIAESNQNAHQPNVCKGMYTYVRFKLEIGC